MFDLDNPDLEVFNAFPEWIRDKIKGNLNYEGSKLQKLLGGSAATVKEKAPPVGVEDANGGPPWEESEDNPY